MICSLLENNESLFRVYNYNKLRLDSGHVIGDLDNNYDCFINAGISANDKSSIEFLNKYELATSDCYAFDGTIEKMPDNFVKNNTNLCDVIDMYNNIFLKMDIEGGEWPWLLSIDEDRLNKISQLSIEMHGLTNKSWHNNFTIHSFCSYDEKVVCLKKLGKTHYLIHAHGNNSDRVADDGLPNVIKLTYIHKRFYKNNLEFNTKSLPITGLDYPNDKNLPDVNLSFYPFVSMDLQTIKNPFLIDIADKDEYTSEDYENIQKQLVSKHEIVDSLLQRFYNNERNGFYKLIDFKNRISRGITQKIFDADLFPSKQLYKIGDGGNHKHCIVCCTPLSHIIDNVNDNTRYLSSQKILRSLEEVGFNGYLYILTGGFPNPSGTEMKYVGVPYCFKIFMILEAEKIGFDKVIWIDSGCYALNNLDYLFNALKDHDIICKTVNSNNNYNGMVLKTTNDLLNQLIGYNLKNAKYIETIVFGLNMSSSVIKNIIREYYEMVKIGWVFFSIFPEEIVLSAIINKPEYKHLLNNSTNCYHIQIHEGRMCEMDAKNNGFYFHHKDYSKFKKSYSITFDGSFGGRFGNQLFRYLTAKLFTVKFKHTYVPNNEFLCKDYTIVTDDNIVDVLENKNNIAINNIVLKGYFQKSNLFLNNREELLNIIFNENNNDYWSHENTVIHVKDYIINSTHSIKLTPDAIVVSLRLDDFIQLPCATSDIIPPQYYIDILNKLNTQTSPIYIVCDKINHDWEKKYVEHFEKWNPIVIQNTLIHDIALMRDCKTLVHSNSSLCWIISFLSNKDARFIPCLPKIYMNQTQSLNKISAGDVLTCVTPLDHEEVFNLNADEESIFPFSFCVPDECVVNSIPEKTCLLASLIPGDMSTYIFDKYKEKEYNEMYRQSRFAITKLKGGWDCLRHYEILMNGCIPLFENLNECPTYTLTTYPKHLNDAAYELFNTWIESEECIQKYNKLCNEMLQHTRTHCSTSAAAKYFLSKLKNGNNMKNILLITCHSGVNYNRETLWIGLKRHLKSIGGVGVEYDKMPFLYDDFDNTSEHKYYTSNCFTFPKRLEKDNDYNMNEAEIIEKINSNFWDLIIYGKVGPDEFCKFPLYDIVKTKYNKNKIAFIFGGDEIFDLSDRDTNDTHINMFNVPIYYYPYKKYLNYYKQFGSCFVRELNK